MGRPRRTVLVTSRWVASAAVMAAMATGATAAPGDDPAAPRGSTSASAAGHASEALGEGSGGGAEPGRVEELQRGVDLRKA